MKTLVQAAVIAFVPSLTFAQTPVGHEVNVSVGHYTYVEPGDLSISIHGARFGGEYTGTFAIDPRRHWFAQANARGTIGSVRYDGWCLPWLITPSSASPNGYLLDLGDASPCSETGDKDWYLDTRAIVGKDFIGRAWAFSPDVGLGLRHLSNGTTGVGGYRTDNYLYVPVGLTARTTVGAHRPLSVHLEYDQLVRGWQKTRDSAFGSADLPATSTAPAFTINGLSDVSFAQHGGWAVRASVKFQVNPRWFVEPSFVRWNVHASTLSPEIVTFTVNGVTAQEQLGAYEPVNVTREFVVKFGFRF